MLLLSAAFLCSCGGRKAPEENPFRMEQALTQSYENILFYPFETNEEIQKYYPKAREESLHAVIRHLRDKKKYRKIDKVSGNFDKKSTLLVKVRIPDMRIVGGVARAFGGTFLGSSHMSMEAYLIDAESGNTVKMKALASANNPWAAAWTIGDTDRSLPSDMGHILGEYIATVVPARAVPAELFLAATLAAEEQTARVDGTIRMDTESPYLDLTVRAQDLAVDKILKGASYAGPVTADVHVTGPLAAQRDRKSVV